MDTVLTKSTFSGPRHGYLENYSTELELMISEALCYFSFKRHLKNDFICFIPNYLLSYFDWQLGPSEAISPHKEAPTVSGDQGWDQAGAAVETG